MLQLIGLGLGDEKDVTVRGLEAIKAAERVYLEAYTSILGVDQSKLVRFVAQRARFLHNRLNAQGRKPSMVEN